MHPIICKIGPFTLYSYGFTFALGSFIALFLMIKEAKKRGIEKNLFYDIYLWVLIGAIIGARLLYCLTNIDFFLKNPLEIIKIQHGGLSWFGGFVFGLISFFIVTSKYKKNFFEIADICLPYVALAQAIGRIGCFLNGCCYGKVTDFIINVKSPFSSEAVHPTQLYSSLSLFLIFVILKFYQRIKLTFRGEIFCMYLFLSGLERFLSEFLRGDTIPTPFFGLTLYQAFSLIWILVSLALFKILKSNNK